MKFNLNPIEFLKNRGEQSALKTTIQNKMKAFEANLAYAKIDWKKSPHEMEKMKVDELIALRQAANVLNGYTLEIKTNFDLSNDVRQTLDVMKKTFKDRGMDRWDDKKEGPYVIEPMASQLHSSMNILWSKIHKLKTASFDSIIS